MSPSLEWWFPQLAPLLTGVGVFLGVTVVLLIARLLLFRRLRRWSRSSQTGVDDLLVGALDFPSIFWVFALAVSAGLSIADVAPVYREGAQRGITILLIVSVTLVVSNIAAGALAAAVARSGQPLPSGLGQGLARAVIGALGAMVLLNSLGVEIAPLLTALGVGGLAVALALQDTLSNFFAGIHVLMERPFTIGDFVRLENGMEGTVLDISWRTTRLRTLQDHVVVLPNSKIAGSTLVNYHLPDMRTRLTIELGVTFGTDLERVRAALLDEARAVVAADPVYASQPGPDVGIVRVGESSVQWMVRFHVQDIRAQFVAIDTMHRRVLARMAAEELTLAYPTRRLLMDRWEPVVPGGDPGANATTVPAR